MSRKEIVTRNREYMSSGYFCEWMPLFFRARIGWELEYGAVGRGFVFILPKNQDCEWPYQTISLLEMLLEQLQEFLYIFQVLTRIEILDRQIFPSSFPYFSFVKDT
jgi:hypothetical protein